MFNYSAKLIGWSSMVGPIRSKRTTRIDMRAVPSIRSIVHSIGADALHCQARMESLAEIWQGLQSL